MAKEYSPAVTKRFVLAMQYILMHKVNGIMTKKDFAESIGIYQQNISLIEAGQRSVTLEALCMVCAVYDINSEWLLFEVGNMFRDKAYTEEENTNTRLARMENTLDAIARTIRVKL